jgi:ABC-type phosphate/phosphonate transport system substrate-binding protein
VAKAAGNSDTTRAKIGDSHPATGAATNSKSGTIPEQAVATAAAEHATSATIAAPEQKAKNTDAEKSAPASPGNTDHLVAIIMARPEIKSISDLAGKTIAIDDRQPASHASVRTAIAAAGAVEVQLSEGQTTAINRVASGEVPAAVLTLESPEAAEGFAEIAGFKIFRVPLSPRALKARSDTR